jgi:isopentenyl diphosphate isomerase/L-lactate dehydrogenase-like FMN-dependent dehydrogenase
MKPASLADYREIAKCQISKSIFDDVIFSSGDGNTRYDNEHDFEKITLKLRGLANLKHFKGLSTKILGFPVSSPIGLKSSIPLAYFHQDAESGTALAAKDLNSVYI